MPGASIYVKLRRSARPGLHTTALLDLHFGPNSLRCSAWRFACRSVWAEALGSIGDRWDYGGHGGYSTHYPLSLPAPAPFGQNNMEMMGVVRTGVGSAKRDSMCRGSGVEPELKGLTVTVCDLGQQL